MSVLNELLKTIIRTFHKQGIPDFMMRDVVIPRPPLAIIGPRRAGKTFLLYQIMDSIIKKEGIEKILFISFADERLDLNKKNLNEILEAYFELYPNIRKPFIFFDEIQEVDGWELFVRRLIDSGFKNIYLTGSSSKLLSKELATHLRGRTMTLELLPLSFREFLNFKGVSLDLYDEKKIRLLRSIFLDFLERGGFPEVVNDDFWLETLTSYYDVMLYRDIVERHNVSHQVALKLFLKKAIVNSASEFSIHKTFNELKSNGIRVSKDSLYDFAGFAEDAFMIFFIKKFPKGISQKVYGVDTGLINALSFKLDRGKLLENAVFLELRRRFNEIYYYRNNFECDFIVFNRGKALSAIQVSWDLNGNSSREINGLVEAMLKLRIKNGFIITFDDEDEIVEKHGSRELKIKVMPAWKFFPSVKERF